MILATGHAVKDVEDGFSDISNAFGGVTWFVTSIQIFFISIYLLIIRFPHRRLKFLLPPALRKPIICQSCAAQIKNKKVSSQLYWNLRNVYQFDT